MKITRCEVCVGRKVINGLGNMEKKCYECKGVGYVELVEDEVEYLQKSDAIWGDVDAPIKPILIAEDSIIGGEITEEDMDLIPEEWVSETGEKVDPPLATNKKKPGRRPRLENGKK